MPKQTFLNLPEDKRQRIIEIAIDEFASRSYSKASLSNIVARAGIAKGSMYQYFEDKKDLYIYLLELAGQEKLVFLQGQQVDVTADFFTLFEQMLTAGTKFGLEHPQYGQLMASAMDPSGEEVLKEINVKFRKMGTDFMVNLIKKAQAEHKVRLDLDPKLTGHLLQSMMGNGILEYFLGELNLSMHDFLADPESVKRISDEEFKRVISQVVEIIKGGLEVR
ncbi:MAG: TetR/AcrR family transcriptional regulator [Bacillota bacterium]|nr:TetR/AcrR family transcriptional regulator [Bacillota bacterium]